MIGRQLGHMVRLVDDLLDVSRITHGKIELQLARRSTSTAGRSPTPWRRRARS